MIDIYAEIIKKKLGEQPTVDNVLALMVEHGVLEFPSVRRAIVIHEFWKIYRSRPDRTACDIEMELAARFDMSRRYVTHLRSRDLKKGRGAFK